MLGRQERCLGALPARNGGAKVRKLDTQTLWERVYLQLKQEILEGHVAPGTVLQEVPLAESLGVSRGPVREALGRLASEGLVTVTPRRGAVVAAGNAKLTEMYRLLIGQMGPYRHPSVLLRGSFAVSIAEHRAMIVSARERATERTVELVLHHIRMPQRRLEQLTDAEFLAEVRAGGAASVLAPAADVTPSDPG